MYRESEFYYSWESDSETYCHSRATDGMVFIINNVNNPKMFVFVFSLTRYTIANLSLTNVCTVLSICGDLLNVSI